MISSEIVAVLTRLEESLVLKSASVSPDEFDEVRLRWAGYCITHATTLFLSGAHPRARLYSAIKALTEIESEEKYIQGLVLIASDPRFESERSACHFAIQIIRWRASTRKMLVCLPRKRCVVRGENLALGFSHPAFAQTWLAEWESDNRRPFLGTITLVPEAPPK